MINVIRKSEGTLHKIADNKVAINLITKEVTKDVSLAVIEANNFNEEETTRYDRIYYVTEGELILINEDKKYAMNVGDSCFIPKGTTYIMSGTFKLIVITLTIINYNNFLVNSCDQKIWPQLFL